MEGMVLLALEQLLPPQLPTNQFQPNQCPYLGDKLVPSMLSWKGFAWHTPVLAGESPILRPTVGDVYTAVTEGHAGIPELPLN